MSRGEASFEDRARFSLRLLTWLGLRAPVYTVNDPAEVRRLMALGIDGIITDAVDRFSPGETVLD